MKQSEADFAVLKILFLLVATALSLSAEIQEKVIAYQDGDTALEGFYAHDPAVKSTGKAVLIVHQWTGLGETTPYLLLA